MSEVLSPEELIVREQAFSVFKKVAPLAAHDKIAFEYDDSGNIKNLNIGTEARGFAKAILYDMQPSTGKHLYLANLPNGLGKTYSISHLMSSVICDVHPTIDFKGIQGEFWLITNSKLLKGEYVNLFFGNPGWLGKLEEAKKPEGTWIYPCYPDISVMHNIKVSFTSEGQIDVIENVTTGKKIRCFSYQQNYQTYAGGNPLSIAVDEFGDDTKQTKDPANSFNYKRLEELAIRCGRNMVAKGRWFFLMCFSLILPGGEWVYPVMESIRQGTFIVPEINPNKQCAHLFEGFKTTDNVHINKETIGFAGKLAEITGNMESFLVRTVGNLQEDPRSVFKTYERPERITLEKAREIVRRSKAEPGWIFTQAIDPGKSDLCAVLFALAHPLEGLFILKEIGVRRARIPDVAMMIREIEENYFGQKCKSDTRFFDKHSINRGIQSNDNAISYKWWSDAGIKGVNCIARDRRYDSMYILRAQDPNLVYCCYENTPIFEAQLRSHKYDQNGLPQEKGGDDTIDCYRYLCNWYYEKYWKKKIESPVKEERPAWQIRREIQEAEGLRLLKKLDIEDSAIYELDFAELDDVYLE